MKLFEILFSTAVLLSIVVIVANVNLKEAKESTLN